MQFGPNSLSAEGAAQARIGGFSETSDENREAERVSAIREELSLLVGGLGTLPPGGDLLALVDLYDPRALEGPPPRLLPAARAGLRLLTRSLRRLTGAGGRRPMTETPVGGGSCDGTRAERGAFLRRVLP
jgi:hypothetical protein